LQVKTVKTRTEEALEVTLRAKASAICPLTGIVDVYTVEVSYTPKPGRALEAYSFAEFLESFQDKKILQEELTAEIARKLCATGGPWRG